MILILEQEDSEMQNKGHWTIDWIGAIREHRINIQFKMTAQRLIDPDGDAEGDQKVSQPWFCRPEGRRYFCCHGLSGMI